MTIGPGFSQFDKIAQLDTAVSDDIDLIRRHTNTGDELLVLGVLAVTDQMLCMMEGIEDTGIDRLGGWIGESQRKLLQHQIGTYDRFGMLDPIGLWPKWGWDQPMPDRLLLIDLLDQLANFARVPFLFTPLLAQNLF